MRKAKSVAALLIFLMFFTGSLWAWDLVDIPIPGSNESITWYNQAYFSNGVLVDSENSYVLTVNEGLVMLTLNIVDSSEFIDGFLHTKEDFLRDMREANLSSGLDAFSVSGPANYYDDFSIIKEDIIADYQQESLVFCCEFSCKFDLYGRGTTREWHGKALRFFRFSGDSLLNGSLIYFDELIDDSINTVTSSLIGDLGIIKNYSI